MTEEQCDAIDERLLGVRFGIAYFTSNLLGLANEQRMERIISENTSRSFHNLYHPSFYFMSILKRRGIISIDEYPVMSDGVFVQFENELSRREGFLTLTNNRAISHGVFREVDMGDDILKRIYYEDMHSKPFLEHFDFIDYDKIEGLEFLWNWRAKTIEIHYRTKYIEAKSRTLYGPLFFKASLPKTVKIEDGVIKIQLKIVEGTKTELSKKERAELIFKHLKDTTGL
ncbi:MAG: hypothetical protein P1Q69_14320 [Candidatus Thorarchaeota archaeon]|nr:hypothetical protein [Candidatus Thorarchaeota archaeon]